MGNPRKHLHAVIPAVIVIGLAILVAFLIGGE